MKFSRQQDPTVKDGHPTMQRRIDSNPRLRLMIGSLIFNAIFGRYSTETHGITESGRKIGQIDKIQHSKISCYYTFNTKYFMIFSESYSLEEHRAARHPSFHSSFTTPFQPITGVLISFPTNYGCPYIFSNQLQVSLYPCQPITGIFMYPFKPITGFIIYPF